MSYSQLFSLNQLSVLLNISNQVRLEVPMNAYQVLIAVKANCFYLYYFIRVLIVIRFRITFRNPCCHRSDLARHKNFYNIYFS